MGQREHYENKLAYEIDAWDLNLALQSDANLVLLDARGEDAYAAEHIAGARSFWHRRMTAEGTSELDKHAEYVVYCDGLGCNAATNGALKLARLGFKVKELIGGLDWWRSKGYPVQGGAPVGKGAGSVPVPDASRCDCA